MTVGAKKRAEGTTCFLVLIFATRTVRRKCCYVLVSYARGVYNTIWPGGFIRNCVKSILLTDEYSRFIIVSKTWLDLFNVLHHRKVHFNSCSYIFALRSVKRFNRTTWCICTIHYTHPCVCVLDDYQHIEPSEPAAVAQPRHTAPSVIYVRRAVSHYVQHIAVFIISIY